MPMEAETLTMLNTGFGIMVALCAAVFILLWIKIRGFSIVWFMLHLVCLVVGYMYVLDVLGGNADIPKVMRSEENSLSIGLAAVWWALSVFCMLIGVCKITNRIDSQ
ncbi:hypothetical protein [Paenibacillus mucilaginosus]|uniref:hypothetical protein n=1 Tax=Paenibacillus mucilaginosus TaxID=61624 RepID=UPI00117DFBAC|nr:hypothetical protein [Paenibacillus mucilaginosus]MCG7217507.1 hypothetical protein [Paenibacillus mucilaginosus]WDM31496.1 hypothetical protein KCX80_17865 [Paenibacillus mucilaginosus]